MGKLRREVAVGVLLGDDGSRGFDELEPERKAAPSKWLGHATPARLAVVEDGDAPCAELERPLRREETLQVVAHRRARVAADAARVVDVGLSRPERSRQARVGVAGR